MNILFICDEYPPGRHGGIGTVVQLLARALAARGHRVFVTGLYPYQYGEADEAADNGVQVTRFRYGPNFGAGDNPLYKIYRKLPGAIRRYINAKAPLERFFAQVERLVKRERIDIIEVADWSMFSAITGLEVRWPAFSAPMLVKSHGTFTKIRKDLGREAPAFFVRNDQALFDRADAIAAVSEDSARQNRKIFGIKKEIKVLYNGLPLPEQGIYDRTEKLAIYTGSITMEKGVGQLMKAWNLVQRKVPGARLHLYGKGRLGPMRALLDTEAASHVKFMGHVSRDALQKELSRAALAVFPSYSESLAMAPIEAMGAGCPVVISSRSCGPEIVSDGVDGLLVDPDDVPALATALVRLFTDHDLAAGLAKAGRQKVADKFDLQVIVQEHERHYRTVAENFSKNRPDTLL